MTESGCVVTFEGFSCHKCGDVSPTFEKYISHMREKHPDWCKEYEKWKKQHILKPHHIPLKYLVE